MIRRPPRSTLDRSSAASDVYKRQHQCNEFLNETLSILKNKTIGLLRADSGFASDLIFRHLEPVSYTHLRAHETVLDIVCRLLLEKKKNTHKK